MNNFKGLGARGTLAIAIAALALSGCDSDSSSGGGGGQMLLNGGLGGLDGGTGGDGGYFEVEKYTGAGDIVAQGGRANTAFKVYTNTAELGDNPLVVSSNLDLSTSVLADCGAPAPTATGTPYQVVGQYVIYLSDGNATACEGGETASGLQVNKGATLTLALTNGPTAQVAVSGDIVNNGVITSGDASATDRGNIDLESEDYMGRGQVTTAGKPATEDTAAVPNGGDIDIYANYALLNSGQIDASGADTETGAAGDAGSIYIEGDYYAQNTGTLKSNGGNAEAGDGGDASYT